MKVIIEPYLMKVIIEPYLMKPSSGTAQSLKIGKTNDLKVFQGTNEHIRA
jgi:hypothetical protein